MRNKFCAVLLVALFGGMVGCGGGVAEQTIKVNVDNDPLNRPRALLQKYADGQPMGSEATSFEYMVKQVRESDPQRADILEKGLKELVEAPAASRKAKAKDLLSKIQPSAGYPTASEEEKK